MGRVEPLIHRRIRAALECARFRRSPVRAIYLDPDDEAELNAVATKAWGSCPVIRLSFDDHPLQFGEASKVYLKSGEAIAVPKRLSKRVG